MTSPAGEDPPLAAEVVLRPPGGDVGGWERVTAETIGAFRPSAEAVATATAWFSGRGFTVSSPYGISFTISGPRSVFERELGPLGDEQELPIDRLPPAVARAVQAVTFGPPADYGPPAP